jgi:DNA topoisomerase-3
VDEFIPTTLGVALIEGYESLGFDSSLSKPFLRKEVCSSLVKETTGSCCA